MRAEVLSAVSTSGSLATRTQPGSKQVLDKNLWSAPVAHVLFQSQFQLTPSLFLKTTEKGRTFFLGGGS